MENSFINTFFSPYLWGGGGGLPWLRHCILKAHGNGRTKCQQLPTLLCVVGQQCCVRLHGPKSLTGFNLYATSANIVVVPCKRTQQVTTLLGSTMLGPFAWALRLNHPMQKLIRFLFIIFIYLYVLLLVLCFFLLYFVGGQ